MAVGGSAEELSGIVEEDAFGLRYPRKGMRGKSSADVLASKAIQYLVLLFLPTYFESYASTGFPYTTTF